MSVTHDIIVVGGGAAGLSAALTLGRARRRTLVLDAGEPRNAPSPAAHGVFTRDGTPPFALLRQGRAQLAPYSTVTLRNVAATSARRAGGAFEVELADGDRARTRRVLLAVGVKDQLPPLAGLAQLWGTRVLHCPYCHGWEVRDQPLAVYVPDRAAVSMMKLLLNWTDDLLVCAQPPVCLVDTERDVLASRGVPVVEVPLSAVEPAGSGLTLRFADGQEQWRRALYVRSSTSVQDPVARALGCEVTDAGFLKIGADHQTTVAGVYAAGDAAGPVRQIAVAAASGMQAAIAVNHGLAEEEFAAAPEPEAAEVR
jgi:thioredoxin reductase